MWRDESICEEGVAGGREGGVGRGELHSKSSERAASVRQQETLNETSCLGDKM